MNSETKVFIFVGLEPPRRIIETIDLVDYELRVICVIKENRKRTKTSQFYAMRYMRHWNGNSSWWKQEINDTITTQYIYGEDIYNTIYHPNEDCYLIQYVYVYVIIEHDRNY